MAYNTDTTDNKSNQKDYDSLNTILHSLVTNAEQEKEKKEHFWQYIQQMLYTSNAEQDSVPSAASNDYLTAEKFANTTGVNDLERMAKGKYSAKLNGFRSAWSIKMGKTPTVKVTTPRGENDFSRKLSNAIEYFMNEAESGLDEAYDLSKQNAFDTNYGIMGVEVQTIEPHNKAKDNEKNIRFKFHSVSPYNLILSEDYNSGKSLDDIKCFGIKMSILRSDIDKFVKNFMKKDGYKNKDAIANFKLGKQTEQETALQENQYETGGNTKAKVEETSTNEVIYELYPLLQGERYFVLYSLNHGVLYCEPQTNYLTNKGKGMIPYMIYSVRPNEHKTWAKSFVELIDPYLSEIIKLGIASLRSVENTVMPLMLFNSSLLSKEQLVNPDTRAYAVKMDEEGKIGDAVKFVETPTLFEAYQQMDKLEDEIKKNIIITDISFGQSDDKLVGVHETNKDAILAHYRAISKPRDKAFERLGKIVELLIRKHITPKQTLHIFGVDQKELSIAGTDIANIINSEEFIIKAESETMSTIQEQIKKKTKIELFDHIAQGNYQIQSELQKKALEKVMQESEIPQNDINDLLQDNDNEGMQKEMATEAIKKILHGEKFVAPEDLDLFYLKHIEDYIKTGKALGTLEERDLKELENYADQIEERATQNSYQKIAEVQQQKFVEAKMMEQQMAAENPPQEPSIDDAIDETEFE